MAVNTYQYSGHGSRFLSEACSNCGRYHFHNDPTKFLCRQLGQPGVEVATTFVAGAISGTLQTALQNAAAGTPNLFAQS
jgi:hypothetical protein